MPRYKAPSIPSSEITPQSLYLNRRSILGLAAGSLAAGLAPQAFAAPLTAKPSAYKVSDEPTPKESVTTYNNFYEFGTDKGDPAANAGIFKPTPWTIKIDGMVGKPQEIGLEDLMKRMPIEERVYRMRCVEAWSMVIPWDGFQLSSLLALAEPTSDAKYVAFESVVRPEEMPGQSGSFQPLPWPYVEGLRLDEAMHPLTLLAVGLYGETLPNQNGAPIRLVVPWKYGFKGIKSIVRITLTDKQPPSTWNIANPQEYGFYSNVNPQVDHPRWSQATERRIGTGGFFGTNRVDTLPFNGYATEVASLYEGMDLKANFLTMATARLSPRTQSALIWAVYGIGLLPAAWTFWLGASNQLGADPVKTFERFLGLWAIRFLILTLAVTPLRDLDLFNGLKYRRALGLLAFYYVAMHFAVYAVLDQALNIPVIVADVIKRPFITFGMVGLLLLIPLAVTSSNTAIRRLGARWTTLHQLIYLVAALGALHYSMSLKVLGVEQYIHIGLLSLLLAYRVVRPKVMEAKRARRKRLA